MDKAKTPGQRINEAVMGVFVPLKRLDGLPGSVEARKLTTCVMLYWRFTFKGKTTRVQIGIYDSGAPPTKREPTEKGFSIRAAIVAAESLAADHKKNLSIGGHHGLIEAEIEARQQANEQARQQVEAEALRLQLEAENRQREALALQRQHEADEQARAKAKKYTLANLLRHYCDHMEAQGRMSHKDARSIFECHVFEPWPQIAQTPARLVTLDNVADMIRRPVEVTPQGRTSNKLRSYLHAAYATAIRGRTDPTIPVHFKGYGIEVNPIGGTLPAASLNRTDKDALPLAQMREYWHAIRAIPGIHGALLRLHLLTGAQRIAQLVRLKTSDCTSGTILLHDGKGKPGNPPRQHLVPLTELAMQALRECEPRGRYALSTDGGKTHVWPSTLSEWACKAVPDITDFNAKRLRSGVETELSASRVRVDKEVRGRLQSHGIAGVMDRNYNSYDFLHEKRHALEVLENLLEGVEGGNVIALRPAA